MARKSYQKSEQHTSYTYLRGLNKKNQIFGIYFTLFHCSWQVKVIFEPDINLDIKSDLVPVIVVLFDVNSGFDSSFEYFLA